MIKKIAVYTITALLMGFAVMMLPLVFETKPTTDFPVPQVPQEFKVIPSDSNGISDFTSGSARNTLGQASQDVTPSSIILLTGIVVALVAYIFFKKQMIKT